MVELPLLLIGDKENIDNVFLFRTELAHQRDSSMLVATSTAQLRQAIVSTAYKMRLRFLITCEPDH